jgi:hypothetical protein
MTLCVCVCVQRETETSARLQDRPRQWVLKHRPLKEFSIKDPIMKGKDIVFRFIIEYSSLMDFRP